MSRDVFFVISSITSLYFICIYDSFLARNLSCVGCCFLLRADYGHNVSPIRSLMQGKSSTSEISFHNLRYLINYLGLKGAQSTEAVGIHKGSLSRYFGTIRIPKRKVLQGSADFFKVSIIDFLSDNLSVGNLEAQAMNVTIQNGETTTNLEFEQYVHKKRRIANLH